MSNTQNKSNSDNSLLSLEETRNGHKTIKVNGIYLHSKYDPIKEAQSFVNSNLNVDENPTGYLVLGLGLGYHILDLASRTDKKIIVLESNKNIYNFACDICQIHQLTNVRVITGINSDELFFEHEFVKFLSQKPKTLVHPSSFKANGKFYQDFLSFRSENNLNEDSLDLIEDEYIATDIRENETFSEYSERLLTKDSVNSSEQLVLATYALFER